MTLQPPLEILIALFVASLVIWLILVFYKSRLEREVEEKVLLGSTPERLGAEQQKILNKVNGMSKWLWMFGVLTVVFLLGAVGAWIYYGILRS
jgi:hypothetical protein